MTSLEPVDEKWQSGLAIVAHPDDLEYGAAAAVARWTAQGKRIGYVLLTSGEAGIDALPPSKCGPLREREQRTSAGIVGVTDVEFLGHPDGVIEYGIEIRRDIARVIRRHRPEVIITSNFRDNWGPGTPNQADHIAVGRAVLDGVADAANRWIFRSLLEEEGLSPWQGVTQVLAAGSPDSGHAVEINDFLERGIESLKAHREYLAGLGDSAMSDPARFLSETASATGMQFGCTYAVAFERFTYG